MPDAVLYYPVAFFSVVILSAMLLGVVIYLLNNRGKKNLAMALLLLAVCFPGIATMGMIYGSGSEVLMDDFWKRLFNFEIALRYLMVGVLLMPCLLFFATVVSFGFGYSRNQFQLADEFSVMKRWSILGVALPLVIAPIIEEIGWRGYGVDSIRVFHNLFVTSILFGILWGIWHIPAFFIKGFYQNELRNLGKIYVVNFFVSVVVIGFVMNWMYYKTDRSIPALILFHSILNLFAILFKTEPFTKCILTVLFLVVAGFLVVFDWEFFIS